MADSTGRRLFRRRPKDIPTPLDPASRGQEAEGVPSAGPAVLSPQGASVRPLEASGEEAPADAAGPARRSGPRGERTVTVAVRLTPAEHARWVAAATAGGRGQMGRWVRETVTSRLDGRPVPVPVASDVTEQLAALRAELSKVGSNLNQVARGLNTAARGGPVQVTRDAAVQVIEATKVELGRVRDQLAGLGR